MNNPQPPAPRRSALYVPATNTKALAKVPTLACDAVIHDLEDAVAPEMKVTARANLEAAFAQRQRGRQLGVIRVNDVSRDDFELDMDLVARCCPDAVLVPKVGSARDILTISQACGRRNLPDSIRLWIMVETTAGLMALDEIVQAGLASRPMLDCIVVGTNDIAKDTGVFPGEGRRYLLPWLMNVVLVARHRGVRVLDGVWNDFADTLGFDEEATQSVKMGFDGKTLIHPSQIGPANRAFSPSEEAVAEARAIVAAFARDEHAGAGVINLNGKMVERLHLMQAQRLLALQASIDARAAPG